MSAGVGTDGSKKWRIVYCRDMRGVCREETHGMASAILPDVTAAVVSETDLTRCLTNSDLKMAGVLLHHMVLEPLDNTKYCHLVTVCDNTPPVVWVARMTTKSSSPVARRILRGLAMRQWVTKRPRPWSSTLLGLSISGPMKRLVLRLRSNSGPIPYCHPCRVVSTLLTPYSSPSSTLNFPFPRISDGDLRTLRPHCYPM